MTADLSKTGTGSTLVRDADSEMARCSMKVSVLYVEDDPGTRKIVSNLLPKKFPAAVIHTAENGKKGLELFEEYRQDIVVTDISMPGMDGIQMASSIRALHPGASIIATTAISDTSYLLDAIKIGINRYLLKPIELDLLFETIEECLSRIALERQVKAQNDLIRKLSLAIEQSPSMVMITNSRGAIEYVNHKFSGITGYTAPEVLGQNLRVVMPGTTDPDCFELLWSTVNRGSPWRGEFMNRKKDGELYCVTVSVSPLANEEGGITHFVAVMEDISKRKEAEENIHRLQAELEQRAKEHTVELEASNRELEAFCYSVAHDLSAPLRGMNRFSSVLLEDYSDALDEVGKTYLSKIGSGARRMAQLINDLLDLARVTRTKLRRTTVLLSSLVHEIVQMLSDQEPERRVRITIAAEVEADCDPTLARLALENLLGNAWKYTKKEPCSSIEFGSSSINGETAYFVRDNGIGFDMAYAAKIFVPFERLYGAGEFEGSGVGLATVQRIITRHGGRVWAEGEEGEGATFYFTLG